MSHTLCRLSDILTEYLSKNKRLKWSTRDFTKRALNKLIQAKGDMIVSEFTYNDAEDFLEYLYDLELSPASIKSYVKMVRPVIMWSWRKGYREGDPFHGLKLPRLPKQEIRFYDDAELSAMLASANQMGQDKSASLMWQARIVASASAGLRKSEALHLTVNDVNFDKGYISIQAKKSTRYTLPWSPKNYQCRRVPLTEQLNRLLVNILTDEIPAGQPYLLLTEERYWWLQHLRSQGKLNERIQNTLDENFSRPFRRILERANIDVGTFHDLRKTCITHWTWSLAPQEVRKLAGHADIKTTLEYYSAIRADVLQRAQHNIGATGLEPATS